MRIERKYMAHFMMADDEFVRLGEDLEEFTPELAANVERSRNILGQNRVIITDYEKSVAVEPIYAVKGSKLFAYLQTIIDENRILDDLKTLVVDVKLWEAAGDHEYRAVQETAYIEITSYGGDHNGYRIGFKLHYTGDKMQGLFNINDYTFKELTENGTEHGAGV